MFENVLVGATFGSATRLLGTSQTTPRSTHSRRPGMLDKANVVAGSLDPARSQAARARPGAGDQADACCCSTRSPAGSPKPRCSSSSRRSADLRATGVAIVWIEHIVHALLRVVDRMMAVDAGRKLDRGRPSRGHGLRRGAGRLPRRDFGAGEACRELAERWAHARDRVARRRLRRLPGAVRHRPPRRGGRDRVDHRRQRRRQVDPAQGDRGTGPADARRRSATTGESLASLSAHRRVERGIALVPEGRRIFPSLTVEENLVVGGVRRAHGPVGQGAGPRRVPAARTRC